MIRAGTAVEAAAPLAAKAVEKAGVAAEVAKDKAMQSGAVSDMVAKHAGKAELAKDFVGSALSRAFVPSPEMQAFAKNPSPEGLLANPDLLLQGVSLLSAMRHPKAAVMSGMLQEGMERTVNSGVADKAAQAVVQEGINRSVKEASGGLVGSVPPEVTRAATDYVKQNPQEAMQMMRLVANLR
mmetsp:Transcript_30835/g.65570  ORF Transcript_30835/g.65570 Transcript_30835/m.65570 type:complete len:183 (-) Transcript_30835:257-805(-)